MYSSVQTVLAVFFFVIPSLLFACPDRKYEIQVKELTSLTSKVLGVNPKERNLKQFFKSMPSSFSCFNSLFGYNNNKPAPLYFEPQLHFLLPKMEQAIPAKIFIAKLVSLSVNARWEADQTGALQHVVRSILNNKTTLFITILEGYDLESQESVWSFIFGGPHPDNNPLSAIVQKHICEISNENCSLSKAVYNKKISEEKVH